MPSTISMYWREAMLNRVFRAQALDNSLYVALCQVVPPANADATALSEPPSNFGYARQGIYLTPSEWELHGTEVVSTREISFGTPTGNWGLIQGWAICTDSAGGQLVATGSLTVPRRVVFGTTVTVKPGAISFSLGDASA